MIKRAFGNTGLSVSALGLGCNNFGGRLDIDSVVGEGTTISVYFPETPSEPAVADRGRSHAQARVLLVDDDELIRRYAHQVLTEASYDVVTVPDGETALARVSDGEQFDLLVSDIVLPAMNGFELARAVGRRRPDMARLLMTGFAGADTTGTDLETVAVLSKPFSVDEFLAAVSAALDVVDQGSKR